MGFSLIQLHTNGFGTGSMLAAQFCWASQIGSSGMIWLGQVFCVILSIDEQVLAKALQIPDLRLVRPEYALNVGPDFSLSHATHEPRAQVGGGPYGGAPGLQPKQTPGWEEC